MFFRFSLQRQRRQSGVTDAETVAFVATTLRERYRQIIGQDVQKLQEHLDDWEKISVSMPDFAQKTALVTRCASIRAIVGQISDAIETCDSQDASAKRSSR